MIKRLCWNMLTSIVVVFLLSACQSQEGEQKKLPINIGKALGPKLNEQGFEFPLQAVANEANVLSFSARPLLSKFDGSALKIVPVPAPQFERYMSNIAIKLLKHWKGDTPERIGIFLTAENNKHAFATPGGDIFISLRLVNDLKYEDELASIIAHELAHVLLKHHEDSKAAKTISSAATIATQAYVVSAAMRRSDSRREGNRTVFFIPEAQKGALQSDVTTAAGTLMAVVSLVSDVAVSGFNRHQENVADRFSVEMLHHAGYNPFGIEGVLESLRAADALAEKTRKKHKMQAASLLGMIGEGLLVGLAELSADIKKTHPDPSHRLKRVKKRLQQLTEEGGIQLPESRVGGLKKAKNYPGYRSASNFYNDFYDTMENSPLTQAQVRKIYSLLKTNFGQSASARLMAHGSIRPSSPEKAFKLLASARTSQRTPINYYAMLAHEYAVRKRENDTKKVIATMAKKFSWEATYPTAINASMVLGDDDWKASLLARCKSLENKSIVKNCNKAAKNQTADDDYKNPGGMFGAFAEAGKMKLDKVIPKGMFGG